MLEKVLCIDASGLGDSCGLPTIKEGQTYTVVATAEHPEHGLGYEFVEIPPLFGKHPNIFKASRFIPVEQDVDDYIVINPATEEDARKIAKLFGLPHGVINDQVPEQFVISVPEDAKEALMDKFENDFLTNNIDADLS